MAAVNKTDLAAALKVSLPTLDRMIAREADAFPIVSKGDRGRGYEFDLDEVAAFLQQRNDEAAAAGKAKDELLAQFTLPGIAAAEDAGFTPAERLSLARARAIERTEQRESGFLIETTRLRPMLTDAWARLSRGIDTAVRQTLRDANIPEAVIRQVDARVADAKRRTVEEISAYLTAGGGPSNAELHPPLL